MSPFNDSLFGRLPLTVSAPLDDRDKSAGAPHMDVTQASCLERWGAIMERNVEQFFRSWGTCEYRAESGGAAAGFSVTLNDYRWIEIIGAAYYLSEAD